jgi:hypothetical protein
MMRNNSDCYRKRIRTQAMFLELASGLRVRRSRATSCREVAAAEFERELPVTCMMVRVTT